VIEFIRRRIRWRNHQCTAELTNEDHYLFAWTHKCYEYNDALKEMVPLQHEEWELYADGLPEGRFRTEERLKCFIIRSIYNLDEGVLIPSEILHDAGLVYVNNCWIDSWSQSGTILVEARDPLPLKPMKRNINLPNLPGVAAETYKATRAKRRAQSARDDLMLLNQQGDDYPDEVRQGTKVHDDHRTSLRLVPRQVRQKPYGPRRLLKGDDMGLSWQEENEIWIADWQGAGLDEFDTLDDDECYYVLETGECDAQTCAIVSISPETAEGEEGSSEVQAAEPPSEAEARELHENDFYRFG
jgi:hypothetical protein